MAIPGWAKASVVTGVASLAFVALLVAPLPQTRGQGQDDKDIGKSPKAVLAPKTYRSITQPPLASDHDQMLDYIAARQQVILDQLQMVLDIRKQVITNTQLMKDMEIRVDVLQSRLDTHERAQANDPASLAVLQIKVDGMKSALLWAVSGIGTLLIGGFALFLRRLASGKVVTMEWVQKDAAARSKEMHQYREHLSNKLDEVSSKADAAYHEANQLNEKIAAAGARVDLFTKGKD